MPQRGSQADTVRRGEEPTHPQVSTEDFPSGAASDQVSAGGRPGQVCPQCSVPGGTATPAHPPWGASWTQLSWRSPVMRSHPRGPAEPGVHGGGWGGGAQGSGSRGWQIQRKLGAGHGTLPFPPKEEECSWKQSEGRPGQDSLSHFEPPMGPRARPTDRLPLKGHRGGRAARHWVGF